MNNYKFNDVLDCVIPGCDIFKFRIIDITEFHIYVVGLPKTNIMGIWRFTRNTELNFPIVYRLEIL